MQHHFDVEIAQKYGILEAVLLNHFQYWIRKNEAERNNYHDGKYWSYYTVKALTELFPYVSGRQINYAIQKLIDEGLILTGNFSKKPFDRTRWFTISNFGKSILQNCQMEVTNLSNGIDNGVKCLNTNNDTNDETNNDNIYYSSAMLNEAFLMWLKYKKNDKKQPYRKTGLEMLIKKVNKAVEDYGEAEVIRSIEESIANGWAGLFFGKNQKKGETRIDESKTDLDDIF